MEALFKINIVEFRPVIKLLISYLLISTSFRIVEMGWHPENIGWVLNHQNKSRTVFVLINDNKSYDIYASKTSVHIC